MADMPEHHLIRPRPEKVDEIVRDGTDKLRQRKRDFWWWVRAVAVVLGIVAFLGAELQLIGLNSGKVQDHRTIRELEQQVRDLGGTPVSGPAGQTGATGKTGATGPTGPAQIGRAHV